MEDPFNFNENIRALLFLESKHIPDSDHIDVSINCHEAIVTVMPNLK